MKSYNHLFDKMITHENIILAINNSSKGKRNRKVVKKIYENPDVWMDKIIHYANNFHNKKHEFMTIYDGINRKQRNIVVPKYDEQIIHHMVVNVLYSIFMKGMYEHSYGSIPGRGMHSGKRTVEKWIKHDKKNVKYCLKMDIRKFFDSIPHDILKEKLSKKIHDEKFLKILFEIIDVIDKGLPLGFYTSQWLANWYLQDFDHFVKEQLHATHYIRYMDDMVIFASNKRKLHKIRIAISEYLDVKLGLTLKENWQLFRFDYTDNKGNNRGRHLDFMGFRFYRNKTTMRRSIMLKATRKAKRISKKDKPTIYDIHQMLSYLSWIKYTDTYGMYLKYIKPYVSIKYCKNRMSNYDKRQNKLKAEETNNDKLENCERLTV